MKKNKKKRWTKKKVSINIKDIRFFVNLGGNISSISVCIK